MRQPDQLDMQIHVELVELRRQFADARQRASQWEPAPTDSNRTRYAPVRTNNQ